MISRQIDDRYIKAANACYKVNSFLEKLLDESNVLREEDERFFRRVIKICSDLSYIGSCTFRYSWDDSPIYYLKDAIKMAERYSSLIEKLIDLYFIDNYEYEELNKAFDVLQNVWASNVISYINPAPSKEEYFRRFKCEREVT